MEKPPASSSMRLVPDPDPAREPAIGSAARAAIGAPLRYLEDGPVARNVEEARAFASVVDYVRRGKARLAYSSISFGEGVPRDGSPSIGRVVLAEVLGLGLSGLSLVLHDQRADTDLVAEFVYRMHSIAGEDAIHTAAAILEGAWYFVTGDDGLRRRLGALYLEWSLPCSAEIPVSVLRQLELGARG